MVKETCKLALSPLILSMKNIFFHHLFREEILVEDEKTSISIPRKKMRCLEPGGWLNDEVNLRNEETSVQFDLASYLEYTILRSSTCTWNFLRRESSALEERPQNATTLIHFSTTR